MKENVELSYLRRSQKIHLTLVFSRMQLSLVACVTLLQIPVPMLHQHSSFESQAALRSHIDDLHEDVDEDDNCLHWHLVLPRELGSDDESPDELPPSDVALIAVSGSGACAVEADWFEFESLLSISQRSPNLDSPTFAGDSWALAESGKSFPILRASLRTCAVLCVMRV